MKRVEERKEVEIHANVNGQIQRRERGESWGDNLPIVRLGSEVGFVNHQGNVFPSIEAAFVSPPISHVGCKCVGVSAVANVKQSINKMAGFLALVAMGAKPSEIAQLMFHGEIFMFETFTDMMEQRRLVVHVDEELAEGYQPLALTEEGEAGLRMCLESEMVDLPADIYQETVQLPRRRELEPVISLEVTKQLADERRAAYNASSRGRAADMRRLAKSKR